MLLLLIDIYDYLFLLLMDDDGRRMMMTEERQSRKIKYTCRGPVRELSWGTNRHKNMKSNPKIQRFFCQKIVIERYGYQSIRTDLIKLSRLVLSRFEAKK